MPADDARVAACTEYLLLKRLERGASPSGNKAPTIVNDLTSHYALCAVTVLSCGLQHSTHTQQTACYSY